MRSFKSKYIINYNSGHPTRCTKIVVNKLLSYKCHCFGWLNLFNPLICTHRFHPAPTTIFTDWPAPDFDESSRFSSTSCVHRMRPFWVRPFASCSAFINLDFPRANHDDIAKSVTTIEVFRHVTRRRRRMTMIFVCFFSTLPSLYSFRVWFRLVRFSVVQTSTTNEWS